MNKSKVFFILSFSLFLFNVLPLPTFANSECAEDGEAVIELITMCDFGLHATSAILNPTALCGNASVVVRAGEECNSMMYVDIYLVNLEGFNTAPSGPGPYSLPFGMPDIFVEYDSDLDGVFDSVSEPVNEFYYEGTSITREYGNHHVFKKRVILGYDKASVCPSAIHGTVTTLSGHMAIQLMEYSALGGYQTYPVEDYSGQNDVMSCDIFFESCGYCDPECPIIPPVYEPSVCYDCATPCKDPAKNRTDNASEQAQNLTVDGLIQEVSPNPFVDELNIQFATSKEEMVEFSIIDIKGSIVQSRQIKSITGVQQMQLDLANLAPGVYHCQIKTATDVETVKVIKNRQ